jgi:hypothetical protein
MNIFKSKHYIPLILSVLIAIAGSVTADGQEWKLFFKVPGIRCKLTVVFLISLQLFSAFTPGRFPAASALMQL